MDWIERLFRVSPDGGNGMLEAAYYGVMILGIAAVVFWRRVGRWIGGRRGRES